MEKYDYVVIKATVSKYDRVFDFHEDMGRVLYNGKFGFIDKMGHEVIKPDYDMAMDFQDGLVAVIKDNQKFFINKKGEKVSKNYDKVLSFQKGYAIVSLNNKYGLINKNMEEVIPLNYDSIDYPSNDLILVEENGILKYLNLDNQVVITLPKNIKEASSFKNGLAKVVTEGYKVGFIDKTGRMVINPIYNTASSFENDLASVSERNEGSTIIYRNGEELFPRSNNFEILECASKKGIFIANFGYLKKGLIDRFGNFVTDRFYPYIYKESDGLIRVKDLNHNYGFINSEGCEVIPTTYSKANDFKEGLAVVFNEETNKYGYINKNGEVVIPFIYDNANDFNEGYAVVRLDGCEFYIDKNNKPLHLDETKQKIIEVMAPNRIPSYVEDFNCERDFMAYKTKIIVSSQWEPQVVVTRDINDYEGHMQKVVLREAATEKSMQDLTSKSKERVLTRKSL